MPQQAAVESVTVWTIIQFVFMPLCGFAFLLIWKQIGKIETEGAAAVKAQASSGADALKTVIMNQRDENSRLWAQLNALRDQHAAYQVDAERRYINQQSLGELKKEIFGRFDRLDRHIDALIESRIHND